MELFPDARFVHIHRNPYQIFQSCRHYYDTATWYSYLQRPDLRRIDDGIIRRYRQLHDAFFAERALIPEGRFHEIRYADLERDPVGEMRTLYQRLHLDGFDSFEPELRDYLHSVSSYQKNRFPPLDEPTREKIATAWKREFDEWHYPI